MDHDPSDRGQARTGSAVTLSSEAQLPAWWPKLTVEMDRLMKLLPPEGHTAAMIGQRSKAAGIFLAERYRNRPEVVEALQQIITRGLAEWTRFPPPSDIVQRLDSWLGFESRQAEVSAMQERMKATRERQERERLREIARINRKLETDPDFAALVAKARREGLTAHLRRL